MTISATDQTAKTAKLRLCPLDHVLAAACIGLALSALQPQAANAQLVVTVDVGGKAWDITRITGGWTDVNITKQPWYRDVTLAIAFAEAVGPQLGLGNIGADFTLGPWFAYLEPAPSQTAAAFWGQPPSTFTVGAFGDALVGALATDHSWALASECVGSCAPTNWPVGQPLFPPTTTTVPGPIPLLGVGAAFGYSRKLRKRIKSSKLPVASAID